MKNIHTIIFLLAIAGTSVLGGCSSSMGVASNFAEGNTTAVASHIGSTGKIMTTSAKLNAITGQHSKRTKTILSNNTNGTAYFIGVQDVVEVSVFRVSDLSKTVQVSDAGTINLPLIGTIQAAGKTARQIELLLTKKLGAKYLQNPQVNVFVKEFNSQKITINGAVKKPGVFPVRGKTTLVSVIAMAGGFQKSADSSIVVFRTRNGKQQAARFSVSAIQSGSITDPVILSGDRIVAGHSMLKATFNNLLKALPVIGKFALL